MANPNHDPKTGRFTSGSGGSGGGGRKPKVNMAKYNRTTTVASMKAGQVRGGNRNYEPPKIDVLKNPYAGRKSYRNPDAWKK